MNAIVLNDSFVNSISKSIIVVPNKQARTIELIFTEDGKQDLRLSLTLTDARELRDFVTDNIVSITLPSTPKLPRI